MIVGLISCSTYRAVVIREHPDSVTVRKVNEALKGVEAEIILRGTVLQAPTVQGRNTVRLAPPWVLAIGPKDTATIPIEYIAEIRGTHPRSEQRILVGAAGGMLSGTAIGIAVAPAAPLVLGLGGALVGVTIGALSSQRVVVEFRNK
ncbi:MAG: hypothetical protein NZ606_07075 [Candidatus Kapabacteria bacterium]|nr:hypothetical protein [Candidatus Kapabacteria bacterium]